MMNINVNAGTKMKKLLLPLLSILFLAGCGDEIIVDPIPTQNKVIVSNIKTNTTWYSDTIYQLGGRIAVEDGATLTIQPGTIIKGEAGTGANATALLIARGGKLMAEGTASQPIIFTSVADEISQADIAAGNFASPNLDPTVNGLWGGLIVLGNAPISASNTAGDVSSVQIEGIPTSDQNGLYGGINTHDNSGVLSHISIRHGGANIGSGNEINGLTLGGVGMGTSINNIEVVANQDDGIEMFGGTANLAYVVSWNVGDDGFDTDQSWAGSLNDFVIINPSGHCFELDGPEGSYQAGHLIQNGDIYVGNGQDLINVDENSIVDLFNLYFTDIQGIHQINRTTAPGVTFGNIVLDVDNNSIGNYINGTLPQSAVVGGQIPKANTSNLSWTWAAQSGKF
jgi:hypothetical protein